MTAGLAPAAGTPSDVTSVVDGDDDHDLAAGEMAGNDSSDSDDQGDSAPGDEGGNGGGDGSPNGKPDGDR